MIRLIVGLGNPGEQYSNTRHNAGFMVVDKLAAKLGVRFESYKNLGEYAKAAINGNTVYLAKPLTYMNESGKMVSHLAGFYKIKPQEILVCFDDMSIDLGTVRMRLSGSAGGQNGMKSIIAHLGTQDIPRLRFGIGPKPERFDAAAYVLSKFTSSEKEVLSSTLTTAAEAAEAVVTDGLDRAMNKYNK
ncbi:PTH1 family peptidyl-tRNA hydrolase [Elusimicrobium simillimum]|uniref:aminoacyl-tRNA hydrolase n=1 Tax=Elusimicrobium simillimum TaxID=3143438 RepID=UPI003C6F731C